MRKLFNTLLILIFLISQVGCYQEPRENTWKYAGPGEGRSEFVREYLSPIDIIWSSDESGTYILNPEALLEEGNCQADLVGENLYIMAGDPEKNPALILDFGKQLNGGISIVTGMYAGNEPVKVRITFGESVSEAKSRVESSTATNDHAMRDFELLLPWLGKIEVGNTGFRYVKIELIDTHQTLELKEVRAISIYRDIPYLGS